MVPGVDSRLIGVQGTEYAIVNWPDLLKVITAHEMIQKFLATQGKKVAMEAAGGAARGSDTDMLVNEPAVDVAPSADVSAATDGALPMPVAAAVYSSALVDGTRFVEVPASVLAKEPAETVTAHVERETGAAGGIARAVVNREGVSPGCFEVTCKNASMYGKRMRDVHIAGFSVKSALLVRFRSSDCKVAVGVFLVEVDKYSCVKVAQRAICKMIEDNNGKVSDLDSLEVDKELFDQKVCTLLNYIK